MRFSLLLPMLLFVFTVHAQETATLQGRILDENNQAIPYASVYIGALNKGVQSDETGFYTLSSLPFGSWTVSAASVGYRTVHQDVSLNNATILTLNFSLSFDNELEQVEVFGNRNHSPDKIESITRLPLKPYEQIQSISILSGKLIEDQGALTIAEATKNAPGVYSFATYGNKRESMSSRGFRGIPILKNGVRVHSDFRGVGILTDMHGVDNIQILKGSAAITQGVATDLGSPGGIINIVTKTPKYNSGGSVSLRGGSYGQVRPTFDFYGPFTESKNTAFRVNGALERADSYRKMVDKESFYFNPSFSWKINKNTTFIAEIDHFYDSRTPDLGTVNLASNDIQAIYDMPHNQFLGYKNDRSITENTNYALRIDHELSDKLNLRAAFYSSSLTLDDKGAGLGRVISIDEQPQYHLRERSFATSTRSDRNSVLQFDLVGDNVHTGTIKHTFQIGMDYRANAYRGTSASSAALDTIDVFAPIPHRLPEMANLGPVTEEEGKTHAIGFVAQDVITWTDWLKTFIGARYSTTQTTTPTENTRSSAFNPLGGLIVSPTQNINIFASYTNSSYPRSASLLGKDGKELGNERFDQLEAGVKTSWLNDRLRFNLTLYKINNKNINLPVYDETWSTILHYTQGGNDQRQGVEVELTGRPIPNLEVIGGYSYIDAQYKDHTSFVYGSAPLNTPKHTFNAYANYWFKHYLKGFSLGAGVYYTGDRPINDWSKGPVTHEGIVPNQKPFYVAAYTLVNVQASYRLNEHWNFQILVNNVFDTIGYNAYRTRFINQTDPRNFSAVVHYRF